MTKYLYRNGNGINPYFHVPIKTTQVVWVKLGDETQTVAIKTYPEPEPADVLYCTHGAFIHFTAGPPPVGIRNVKIKLEVEG